MSKISLTTQDSFLFLPFSLFTLVDRKAALYCLNTVIFCTNMIYTGWYPKFLNNQLFA